MSRIWPLANYTFRQSTHATSPPPPAEYDKGTIGLALSGPCLSQFGVCIFEEKNLAHILILESTKARPQEDVADPTRYTLYSRTHIFIYSSPGGVGPDLSEMLSAYLGPHDWSIGRRLATWYRPNHDEFVVLAPFLNI